MTPDNDRQQKLMDALERPFEREVKKELNRFIREQSKKTYATGNISNDDFSQHKINLIRIATKRYGVIIRAFTLEIERQVNLKGYISLEQKRSFWDFLLIRFMTEFGAKFITGIAETTRNDIQKEMSSVFANENAVSESQYIRRILKVRGFSRFRANMIARTETHRASMYASIETAKNIQTQTGTQLKKEWNSTEDARVRPDHASVDGVQKGMSESFLVGGELMDRPNDPNASAKQTINCRCVLTYSRDKGT